MDVILDVWDPTARGPHHFQRVGVQPATHVEPEEHLHVFDLGGEGRRAPLGTTARLGLQVVEAPEVVLQDGLTGGQMDHVDAIKAVCTSRRKNTICNIQKNTP